MGKCEGVFKFWNVLTHISEANWEELVDDLADVNKRVRRFFGTQNNYVVEGEGDDARPVLFRLVRDCARIIYFAGACEVGDQGTPHVQFYFEVASTGPAFKISQVQQWPTFAGQGCALFVAKGNRTQASNYCLKAPNPVGWVLRFGRVDGELVQVEDLPDNRRGRRTDWEIVHELAQRGAPDRDFVDQVPHLAYRHIGLISSWRRVHQVEQQRDVETRAVVFVGPTGAGKTERALRFAAEAAGGRENVFFYNSNRRWMDGYHGQPVMFIDEFNGSFFSFDEIKRLLDRTPYRVEQRGVNGGAQFMAHTVVLTSNHHPRYWYSDVGPWDNSNPLLRRLQRGEVYYIPAPREVLGETVYQEPILMPIGNVINVLSQDLAEGLEFLDEYENDYRMNRRNNRDFGVPQ